MTPQDFLKQIDERDGSLWTESDDDICKALVEFSQIQNTMGYICPDHAFPKLYKEGEHNYVNILSIKPT